MIPPITLLLAICSNLGVSLDDMRGIDTTHPMRAMRSLAMAAIRERCGLSYPKLARLFHRLDHSTVLAVVRTAPRYRAKHPHLQAAVVRAIGGCEWKEEIAVEALELCA